MAEVKAPQVIVPEFRFKEELAIVILARPLKALEVPVRLEAVIFNTGDV